MRFPKQKTTRDPKFLDFVRAMDCAHCGAGAPSEPSHYGGKGKSGGMGLKASDLCVAPLCHECHSHWHQHARLPMTSLGYGYLPDESRTLHIEYNRDALAAYVESLEAF